jgi:hypothetical protein
MAQDPWSGLSGSGGGASQRSGSDPWSGISGRPDEPEERKRESGGGILGTLGNLMGDVAEAGKGLGSLIMMPVADAWKAGADVLEEVNPLISEDVDHDYALDDLAKAMIFDPDAPSRPYGGGFGAGFTPSLADKSFRLPREELHRAKGRWEPLLPGGTPAGESWEQFQEHPLDFILDAELLATGGGAALAKGAQLASRSARVGGGLADLARTGTTTSRTARAADKLLPGLKNKAMLEAVGDTAAAEKGLLAGTRPRVSASGTAIEQVQQAWNPARRTLVQSPLERLLSEPVSALPNKIARYRGLADETGDLGMTAEANRLQSVYDLATSSGLSRVPRPTVSKARLARQTNKMTGGLTSAIRARSARFVHDIEQQLKHLDPEQAENFYIDAQISTPVQSSRMTLDSIRNFANDEPTFTATHVNQEFADAVRPDIEMLDDLVLNPNSLARSRMESNRAEAFADRLASSGRTFRPGDRRAQFTPEEDQLFQRAIAQDLERTTEMGTRYVESLSESVTGQIAEDRLARAFEGINLARHREFMEPLRARYGAEAYSVVFERSYQPIREALRAKIKGSLSRTKRTSKGTVEQPFVGFVDELYDVLGRPDKVPDALTIDTVLRETMGRKAPIYVPHISAVEDVKFRDLLRKSGPRGGWRSTPAGLKHSGGRLIRSHLEGNEKALITDPATAYLRRSREFIHHTEYARFLEDAVTRLGRPIDSLNDLAPGEKYVNLDTANFFIGKRHEILRTADDQVAAGAKVSDAMEGAAVEAMERMPDELGALAARKPRLYAVPKVAADRIDKLGTVQLPGWKMQLLWDGPSNLWRQTVLYTRPDYLYNNMLGNAAFHFIQGGSPVSILRQLSPRYVERIREVMRDVGVDVEFGFYAKESRLSDLGELGKLPVGKYANAVRHSRPGKAATAYRDWARGVTTEIEAAARRQSFLTAMDRQARIRGVQGVGRSFWRSKEKFHKLAEFGDDPAIRKAALEDVNKFMFDYGALAPWEQNIMRRVLMPFYSFWKHSVSTLVRLPLEHPGKTRVMEMVNEFDQEMNEDLRGGLPGWMQDAQLIGPGALPGTDRVLTGGGTNPLRDPLTPEGESGFISQMHPFLQYPMETMTGRDAFSGRSFSHPDVHTDPYSGDRFRQNPETGEWEKLDRFGPFAPVFQNPVDWALSQVPPVELYKDVRSGGARYSAADEPIMDEQGNPRYRTSGLDQLLNYLLPGTARSQQTER